MIPAATLEEATAGRFAALALSCVHREYPNKIAHVLNSDADARTPRQLTPSFYGCYDWHSSVHGHWLLARLARLYPNAPFAARARTALGQSLSAANLRQEAEYMRGTGRNTFERPYGLAWLLQLAAELRIWKDDDARKWLENLKPLEAAAIQNVQPWLAKLTFPVRSGEHSNSAFGLGLMIDSARTSGDRGFAKLLEDRVRSFYLKDEACPLRYEPSGEDFLSPCLAEADVVRRVLPGEEFATWLGRFMPDIPRDGSATWLKPGVVADPTDGKLAHLDGLNLSRAWMLERIAAALPAGDRRVTSLRATSEAHGRDGLRAVSNVHYEGAHWLGTFAVYLTTR